MENQDGDFDFCGAGIHAIDEFREGAEQPEGVFLDVVGIGFGLLFVKGGLGDLHILLASQRIERNASERQGGGGNLNQGNFPDFDIVFEAHEG